MAGIVIQCTQTYLRSKSFETIAAAVVFLGCRVCEVPTTIRKIVTLSHTKERMVNKCIQQVKKIIHKDNVVSSPAKFVEAIGEKIQLGGDVKKAAMVIASNLSKLDLIKSEHPITIGACCVKIAASLSHTDFSFDQIAKASGIAKITIKNMFRSVFPFRFQIVTPDCALPKSPAELRNI
eukprot:TRINITY_DN6674_c0_g2_i2.p1 TRINITY_DN6674_c0_g2~~TRINITY_DN6674_c0_g2_i2.p1  ORF type:complete len:179 (+),score=53.29 TRINITY_DN6674_c0_g2_i2:2-538(+)